MSVFAGALIIPQWQGAGRRIGYLAGIVCPQALLPASLPRYEVDCPDQDDLAPQDGVKALSLLAANAMRAAAIRDRLQGPTLTIGGDCSVDLINAAAANAVEDAALVWIDGHADLNNPATSPSGHYHGMVVRSLMGDGPAALVSHVARPYRASQIFYAGLRDCDPGETEEILRSKIFTLPVGGDPAALVAAIKAAGLSRLHLHLDLDCLDPVIFPYIGVPAPHGLDLDQLCDLLTMLRRSFTLAGASVTECNLASEAEAANATPMLRRIVGEGLGLTAEDVAHF
ncbi:MAG TPA: arginase family protein [Dongiaceae bacterium]|nr:arginase family protein [Dongiaceae bacterium]